MVVVKSTFIDVDDGKRRIKRGPRRSQSANACMSFGGGAFYIYIYIYIFFFFFFFFFFGGLFFSVKPKNTHPLLQAPHLGDARSAWKGYF